MGQHRGCHRTQHHAFDRRLTAAAHDEHVALELLGRHHQFPVLPSSRGVAISVFIGRSRNGWVELPLPFCRLPNTRPGCGSLSISLAEMKWMWFFPYLGLMLLTHHLVLFLLEASDWSLFGLSLWKAFLSTMLGAIVFTLLELFNKGK